ncbi:MAG: RDD family protein [Pseudomonadota bacterium]
MSKARAATHREPARRRIEILPPEGVPIGFEVAGLGARLGAQLIDILLTTTAVLIVMFAVVSSDWVRWDGISAIAGLVFFAFRVPYYAISEIVLNGQTLGKRVLGLRVLSADGRSLTPHAVVLRNLLKEVEVFGPATYLAASPVLDWISRLIVLVWIAVVLGVPIFNRRNQRLGDIAAGTVVVVAPRPRLLPDLAQTAAAERFAFETHHLDHYGRFELQTLEHILQVDSSKMSAAARTQHNTNLARVRDAIIARIEYEGIVPEADTAEFLRTFYRTQRRYLENRRLFGDAREDKFHREPEG